MTSPQPPGLPPQRPHPTPPQSMYAGVPSSPAVSPKKRSAVPFVVGIVAVLVLALVVGGVGWSQGWFGRSSPTLKPAAGQEFPATFGDGNVQVETSRKTADSAFYRNATGQTFTMGITQTTLLLTEAAKKEKPETTRTYGEIYCFGVVKSPQLCHRQLAGGWLTFSSSTEWDTERIATIMGDFYAQLKS